MADIVIHPIWLFEMNSDKSTYTYRLNAGTRIMVPGYVWYIEGAGERILVDAGGDVNYMWNDRKIPARDIQTLDAGLGKYGLTPKDIDIVILTHLHQDHAALAYRFTKARLLVQRAEFEFAMNPHPVFAQAYEKRFFEKLKFELIDGDAEIKPGISVIKSPGHTPGGQSVAVKTAKGTVVICGVCAIRENVEPAPPAKIITPGIHSNPLEAYDSLLKLKKMADIIIPLHDAAFENVSTIP